MSAVKPPNLPKATTSISKDQKKSVFRLPDDTLSKIGTFLNAFDLAQWRQTHCSFPTKESITKEAVDKKRQEEEERLRYVFNADSKRVIEFFTTHPNEVLARGSYSEGYLSRKLNKFVLFRRWRAVSPLQAAALCGDNFLVCNLLNFIIKEDNFRFEAIQQLKEILDREVVQPRAENVGAAPAGAAGAGAAAINKKDNAGSKESAEQRKGKSENTEIEFADSAEYLAPMKELLKAQKAYQDYYRAHESYFNDPRLPVLAEVYKFWGKVGECQKRLPRYILQEYFEKKSFALLPNLPSPMFNTEPNRIEIPLDLDEIGVDASCGLFKGPAYAVRKCGGEKGMPLPPNHLSELESNTIEYLYQLRRQELDNIIKKLEEYKPLLSHSGTRPIIST